MSAAMTPKSESEWPAHFPKGCPPADAEVLSGEVMMLVVSDPPTAKDAMSAMEKGLHVDGPPCIRASLSCARTREHLRELRAAIPAFKKRLIAVARLDDRHGRIKQTLRPGHYSMWLRRPYLRELPTLFKVDER